MKVRKSLLVGVFVVFLIVVSVGMVMAQSFRSSSTGKFTTGGGSSGFTTSASYSPNFQSYYSTTQLAEFWPILDDPASCEARQDILLQVSPLGCSPTVVRSDLLADQNVPVFCQIDALQINPLLDIREIRNIRFTGDIPEGVAGTGFHPARAALKSRDRLLGSPLINNIGYVTVVLERNANESSLPDSVHLDLSAQVDYDSGNALGVGRAQYILKENDARQTFWNGRYSVVANSVEANQATFSIFSGDNKVSGVTVERGKTSNEIFIPGSYCQAALQIAYDSFDGEDEKARIEVSDDRGTDSFDVFEGGRFLNDKCRVSTIDANTDGTGSVSLSCGSQRLSLSLEAGIDVADSSLGAEADKAFSDAIAAFERVADDFPREKATNVAGVETYGEIALARGIDLSRDKGKSETQIRLMEKFIEKYPDSGRFVSYQNEISALQKISTKKAIDAINLDNRFRTVRLVSLSAPTKLSSATFDWQGEQFTLKKGEREPGTGKDFVEVTSIGADSVRVRSDCSDFGSGRINVGDGVTACGRSLILRNTDVEKVAKIRILPKARATNTETNISVDIAIEKRDIKLSPEVIRDRVSNLNDTVEDWEKISDALGKSVEGLKTACFATSAILTFKNLVEGFSGEMLARQFVMTGANGWTNRCKQLVADKSNEIDTLDQCFLANELDIGNDVEATQTTLKTVNNKIDSIEANKRTSTLLEDTSINTKAAKAELASFLRNEFGSVSVEMPAGERWGTGEDESVSVAIILDEDNLDSISYSELRDFYMNLERQKQGARGELTGITRANVDSGLGQSASRINGNVLLLADLKKAEGGTSQGFAAPFVLPGTGKNKVGAPVVPKGSVTANVGFGSDVTHSATLSGIPTTSGFTGGTYRLGLKEGSPGSKLYVVNEAFFDKGDGTYQKVNVSQFVSQYSVGNIQGLDSSSYNNKYKNAEVRYYETEPYKGMPAIVPLDKNRGWYAATRQKLPTFGGIGPFDASGRVVSFSLCNVGADGIEEFLEGNDICTLINLNTGQPTEFVPGLSKAEASKLVADAQRALIEAANQHGNKAVRVLGELYDVGLPSAHLPSVQCQNFMSPVECKALFNVCDPVICPSSRCNLGGQFNVASVPQSGIIGSIALCLPNIKEGIYLPVCLTGVQAGVDAYTSVLKSHRDCLQENLESGKTVGICDQIYSVYTCQLFWKQVAPIANVLIPKAIAAFAGQGARGGGEYLTVSNAWERTRESVDFFTQSYGVNLLDVFRAGAVDSIGDDFCEAFVSASAPTSFKELVEPDSPPQFHAWFSSFKFNDVTVPATAQYKVFYHIFAGKNDGVFYSVYLKDPPEGFFAVPETVTVATGFAGKGDFASETRDFTAPEGYKQLCVNINGEEECGFKQVSTNFALDFLADSYVANQIDESNIQSERECISGTQSVGNLGTAFFGGGLEGIEESLVPEIYNRGVVRICSTQNPGSASDPSRFQEVGHCGDTNNRCWLDKNSIRDAISDNNQFLQNRTIEAVDALNRDGLEAGRGLTTGDADARIAGFENDKNFFKKQSFEDRGTGPESIIAEIDLIFPNFILNARKARLLLVRAELFELLIPPRAEKKVENTGEPISEEDRVAQIATGESPSAVGRLEILNLDGEYSQAVDAADVFVFYGGEKTDIYLSRDKVYFSDFGPDTLIGTIDELQVIKIINRDVVEASYPGLSDNMHLGQAFGREIIPSIN